MKLYQVDVDRVPSNPIGFVKALRVIGKMSLADASAVHAHLVRCGGGTVVAGVEQAIAEHIERELVAAGAAASVVETSVRSPSSCNPLVATMFAWSALRRLEAAR
jgi:hypothetical protein